MTAYGTDKRARLAMGRSLFASGAASWTPIDPAMCMIFVADLGHAAGNIRVGSDRGRTG